MSFLIQKLPISFCKHNFMKKELAKCVQRFTSTYVMKPYSYAYGKSEHQLDYATIGYTLEQRAKLEPSKNAVFSLHENIVKTYGDLNNDVNKIANSFINDFSLKKGDVIALWSANSYNYLVIQYAAAKAGIIVCTLNPAYKSIELEFALKKSGAKLLFLPGEESKQNEINSFFKILHSINLNSTKLESVVSLDTKVLKPLNEKINLCNLNSLLENSKSNDFNTNQVNADDPAIIMFTSGTTGQPKGALLSHSNLVNNAFLTGNRLNLTKTLETNKACIPVPLFHIFGMVYGSIMMSKLGLPIVLTHYKYNVKSVVDAINDQKCTHAMIVPAMTVDILSYLEKTNTHLSSLKGIITGSAPTPVELARRFLKKVPNVEQFLIRYGSTETGGCMTMPHSNDIPNSTIDNVGSPLDFVQIKLVDPKTNLVVKINEQGELWAKGHNVMLGYWDDEEKTKKEITNCKWFKTGDMATMDENGKIKLVGRTKEMIIRAGENVYPKEIEEILHKHQDIQEAFVCGVPDERNGEEICAWIKLKSNIDKKPTNEDIKKFCKDKISYFKVPKHILFVDEFPRTPTGKAQKFVMTVQSIEMLGLKKN